MAALLAGIATVSHAAGFEPDATFGTRGVAVVPQPFAPVTYPTTSYHVNVLAGPGGRILVAGPVEVGGGAGATVVTAFTADGRLDDAFGVAGSATAGADGDRFYGGLAREADGGLIVAGARWSAGEQGTSLFCRLTPAGAADTTFGSGGCVALGTSLGNLLVPGHLRLRNDGSILAVGESGVKATWGPAAMQLTAEGALDPRFGSGGAAALPVPRVQPRQDVGQVVPEADGRFLIAMIGASSPVARLQADGSLDASFGINGVFESSYVGVGALLRRPDGRVIVSVAGGRLIGLTASGHLDVTFGVDGIASLDLPGGDRSYIAAMATLPDGRLLLVGGSAFGSCPDAASGSSAFLAVATDKGVLDSTVSVQMLPELTAAESLTANGTGHWLVGGTAAATGDDTACTRTFALVALRQTTTSAAVEFHHAGLDHYLVSANPGEIDDLDQGVHPGWTRTGLSLPVVPLASAADPGLAAVCRFYIPPEKGDSHFFSASNAECDAVWQKAQSDPNYEGYVYETPAAFFTYLPDPLTGACPAASTPIYRLWNQRIDSGHRYVTDLRLRAAMVAEGYASEGYGPLGVAMCGPAPR